MRRREGEETKQTNKKTTRFWSGACVETFKRKSFSFTRGSCVLSRVARRALSVSEEATAGTRARCSPTWRGLWRWIDLIRQVPDRALEVSFRPPDRHDSGIFHSFEGPSRGLEAAGLGWGWEGGVRRLVPAGPHYILDSVRVAGLFPPQERNQHLCAAHITLTLHFFYLPRTFPTTTHVRLHGHGERLWRTLC